MEYPIALAADYGTALFWFFTLASLGFGFVWVWDLIKTLDVREGWKSGSLMAMCIVFACNAGARTEELRMQSESFAPGQASLFTIIAIMSAILMAAPFALLFSSSNCKGCSDKKLT